MKSFALIALFVALVGLTVAADTDINFNFEGMIPAAGAGREGPKAHHVNVYEVSTTDVTTPGFGGEDNAPLMTGSYPAHQQKVFMCLIQSSPHRRLGQPAVEPFQD